ncbi:predicted protein [Aspergillus terreus NIH2624]|uniref:Cyanovirin-N domain-containing protein n=1 Tax=Aspergillus terreus (strain NIH 2624 / FGSC A1156) TaxID=341663 RepID=Q0C7L7_ASPTN|nr:uncharacterized protein ATEG_10317 [Aspergillus terreus NIH2624]EAU29314.1 predicted protein [Aspergillus terreus NIH2624]
MAWHMSSRQIPGQPWIYNSFGHTHLQAQCLDEDGQWQNSDIDLDNVIGEERVVPLDELVWGDQNFTAESKSVNFAFEQTPAQPILRATFFDNNSAPKNTAERIANVDGHLVFRIAKGVET